MAFDLTRSTGPVAGRTTLLATLLAGLSLPPPGFALGSAAPFTPPRAVPAEAAAASAVGPDVPAADGLIGVRLGTPAMALIDGQWWHLGSAPRGARLLAVDAQGATLRHADGRLERLVLNRAGSWVAPGRGAPATESKTEGATR